MAGLHFQLNKVQPIKPYNYEKTIYYIDARYGSYGV